VATPYVVSGQASALARLEPNSAPLASVSCTQASITPLVVHIRSILTTTPTIVASDGIEKPNPLSLHRKLMMLVSKELLVRLAVAPSSALKPTLSSQSKSS